MAYLRKNAKGVWVLASVPQGTVAGDTVDFRDSRGSTTPARVERLVVKNDGSRRVTLRASNGVRWSLTA